MLKAGGDAKQFKAPREGQLAAWIEGAGDGARRCTLGPGAAKELARRVGGFVREGDVDRQRQGALAVGELEKLALYRPFDPVTEDDVRALVVGGRPRLDVGVPRRGRRPQAGRRGPAPRPPAGVDARARRPRPAPPPASASCSRSRTTSPRARRPAASSATLGMKPFRVDKLVGQARRWTLAELEDALEGLLDLDAMVKGAPDSAATDAQRRLAFSLWIRERVAPAGAAAAP